jgi:hypothetical protein
MISMLPAIKIHVWGGLGSQLYALALKIDLQRSFKTRKVVLIFHNSGVTRRDAELGSAFPQLTQSVKLDYEEQSHSTAKQSSRPSLLGQLIKSSRAIMSKFGFLATANNDNEFSALAPWVFSLRGHYSNRCLSTETLSMVADSLRIEERARHLRYSHFELGIHYRLGDLMTLDQKKPLAQDRLASGLIQLDQALDLQKIVVFSDSLDKAVEMLSFIPELHVPETTLSALDTISALSSTSKFMGTPSKITEWIVLLRLTILPNPHVWVPRDMKGQFQRITSKHQVINYY